MAYKVRRERTKKKRGERQRGRGGKGDKEFTKRQDHGR